MTSGCSFNKPRSVVTIPKDSIRTLETSLSANSVPDAPNLLTMVEKYPSKPAATQHQHFS